jgi:membrane-associated phospholipid phosphatase
MDQLPVPIEPSSILRERCAKESTVHETSRRQSLLQFDFSSSEKEAREDESLSPPMRLLRKLNRSASSAAFAITESHESDGENDASDDDEEVTEFRDGTLGTDLGMSQFNEDSASITDTVTLSSNSMKEHAGFEHVSPYRSQSLNADSIVLKKLEEIDLLLSRPIFRLNLGVWFEYVMLFFGSWFGLPVPSWGLWTASLAVMDEYKSLSSETFQVTMSLLVLAFILYSVSYIRWVSKGKYQRVYGNLKQLAAIPLLFATVFYYGTTTHGYNVGAFFVVSWNVAETIGHTLKYSFHRLRPVAYEDLSAAKRYVPEVQDMFKRGHTAMESFPSADTIGGAVFSATLYKTGFLPLEVALPLSLLIALSRLYLQAHHLLDVTVGLVLGWSTALQMWVLFGADRALGPAHAICSIFVFVVYALAARKFKVELPKHMQRPKSMYGF